MKSLVNKFYDKGVKEKKVQKVEMQVVKKEVQKKIMTMEIAENRHLEIIGALQKGRLNYLVASKKLYEMKKDEAFKLLGYDYWKEYIESSEIGLSRDTANRFVQIYSLFVMKFGVDAEILGKIEWSKLRELLPAAEHAKTKKQVMGLLDMTENYTQKKLRSMVRKAKKVAEKNKNKFESIEEYFDNKDEILKDINYDIFGERVDKLVKAIRICHKTFDLVLNSVQRTSESGVKRLLELIFEERGIEELVAKFNALKTYFKEQIKKSEK